MTAFAAGSSRRVPISDTYGRNHAALTAVVTRSRARGAIREVGKALGLPEDLTKALSGLVWG